VRRAALAAWLLLAPPAVAQDVQETPDVLPPGPGRELVFYSCTACHSTRLVRNQAMSRERWAETLRWMTERQGMPALPPDEEAEVLDYLAEHFGATTAPAGRSPFLTTPARPNPFLPQ
jgi:mono/diheme cytochrome c family protein